MDFYDYSLTAIFITGLAIIIGASEIGRRFGVRAAGKGGSNVATLTGAILGLLALMIGFTFSMTLSRFEARRDAILTEANAIGTAALRARLLPEPQRGQALKLYGEYVKIRLDVTSSPATRADLKLAVDRSNALQETMWLQAKAVVAKDPGMVPGGIYIQALNDMIDAQGKRLAAVRNQMPHDILLVLFGIAAVASAFAGYTSGIEARRSRWPIYITGLLISSIILLILDLDRPNAGFIRISQQPMIDTADSIKSFSD